MPRGLTICLTCGKDIGKGQRTKHLKEAHQIDRGSKPHKQYFKRPEAPAGSAAKKPAAPTPTTGAPVRPVAPTR